MGVPVVHSLLGRLLHSSSQCADCFRAAPRRRGIASLNRSAGASSFRTAADICGINAQNVRMAAGSFRVVAGSFRMDAESLRTGAQSSGCIAHDRGKGAETPGTQPDRSETVRSTEKQPKMTTK
jgi:hypothetical protein